MIATEKRAAVLVTQRPQRPNNPQQDTTTCAYCSEGVNVYQMGDKWICADHLAASVSIASDVWGSDMVHYSREFESVLM